MVRRQLPLQLGFGSTIHKVQGLTLKDVGADLRKATRRAMTYVAMSRVRSMAGLHLAVPLKLSQLSKNVPVGNLALEVTRIKELSETTKLTFPGLICKL